MSAPRSWVVALTGGIAAGKSTVGAGFEALGVAVYDADQAARAAVARGTPGLAAIVEAFGPAVLGADGTLDRRGMRARVFADAAARRRLEAIVHPRVDAWLQARVQADRGPYCLLAIPLLAETWPHYAWVDRVLLVRAPRAVRIQRLCARDGMDRTAAEGALASQAGDAERRAIANDVIDNHGDRAGLRDVIAALHRRYRALAAAADGAC